jgi:hypothetical protein
MKRRIVEQPSYLGRERRVQIAIRFAKDDRDRDLQVSEYCTVDQRGSIDCMARPSRASKPH